MQIQKLCQSIAIKLVGFLDSIRWWVADDFGEENDLSTISRVEKLINLVFLPGVLAEEMELLGKVTFNRL